MVGHKVMYSDKVSKSKLCNWYILFFPVIMILLQYKAPILSYGAIICLVFVILLVLKYRILSFDRELLLLCGLIIIQQFLLILIGKMNLTLFVSNTCMILTVCLSSALSIFATNNIDSTKNMYRYFSRIGYFFALVVIAQVIYGTITGERVSAIPILPLTDEQLINWGVYSFSRPSGFFSEPSAYVSFLTPFLVLSIDRKDYKLSILLTITFLLSSSTQGIAVILLLWGYYFVISNNVSTNHKVMLGVLVILSIFFFLYSDVMIDAREKVSSIFFSFSDARNLNMSNEFSYTNYLRIFKGWDTYFELPLGDQITGVGMNNFSYYQSLGKVGFSWHSVFSVDNSNSNYFSSISGVLIECGIFVGLYYYFYLAKKIRDSSAGTRLLVISFVLQSFVGNMFFNSIFMYYVLCLYIFVKPKYVVKIHI